MHWRPAIRLLAILCAFAGASLLAFSTYSRSSLAKNPLVYSDTTAVAALWAAYKTNYWEAATGRTIDRQQDNITTSEGQSYTMLRAVWEADKPTFDAAWKWTQRELQHDDDNLFAWKWGKRADGSYGLLLDQNGQNAASDADIDIAFALLMAAERWQQQSYLNEAAKIIPRIWSEEVAVIGGRPYLMANDLEKGSSATLLIANPSYIAPYAFRAFAKIDTKHDWLGLVESSYQFLDDVTSVPLATGSKGLPPDWVLIHRQTGELAAAEQIKGLTSRYGYDAMRTSWRLMLDYQWHGDARALKILQKPGFLLDEWRHKHALAGIYNRDGSVVDPHEKVAAYGGNIGYFMAADPALATEYYTAKLLSLYDPNTNKWARPLSYYDENWAWFGMALYNKRLTNLAEGL